MVISNLLLSYVLQAASVLGISPTAFDLQEAACLTKAVYFEARGEKRPGKIGVAHATLNRVNSPNHPTSVCKVVTKEVHRNGKRICAYSWYCENKKITETSVNKIQIQQSSIAAIQVLTGIVPDNTYGATHFFNPDLASPAWARVYKKTADIGNHDFYKP